MQLAVTMKSEREVFAMRKKTMKGMMIRRVFCSAVAFAMVFSSLVLPQGAITAYAEGSSSESNNVTGTPSALIATAAAVTTNKATQIKNGDFEEIPWIDYVYNGVTYTQQTKDTSLGSDKTITSSIRKGVDEGWNTTEVSPYQGNLFEVWPTEEGKMPDEKERKDRDLKGNGQYFIEMNTTNPAALYQDLSTQGGDVIKWTLQHADRAGYGFQEQRMYVMIGAPKMENGQIVAATGVKDQIDTNIVEAGKAEYRYDSVNQKGVVSGSSARANLDELKGLSVKQGERKWCTAAGIYVVPEGQDVTRFAFCADGSSKKDGDQLSGGNFLDNITFSTLIGSLKATKQDDGTVKVTGYWGDSNAAKKLIVDYGNDKTDNVDMSRVCGQYFEITIPAEKISDAQKVAVYHEDYRTAKKEVPITHEHDWKYKDGSTVSGDANKIYAYCAKVEGESDTNTHNCDYKNVSDKKVSLTLNAPDAVYTGEAYKEAWVSNWSITDIGLDAKPEITYYCLNNNGETITETITNASNGGAASEGAAPKNAGTYRAMITIPDGKNPETNVTATKDFTIRPLTIGTVAFTEPTTTPGSSQATSLKTADNAYYKGTISWAPSEGKFGYDKSYTATVTLTLKGSGNCKFADPVQCANSGWDVQSPSDDGTLKLTKTYTTAKAKITSVTAPNVTTQLTEFTTEDKQIEVLPTTVAAVVQDNAKTSMAITWQLKPGTAYSGESEAENTFVWTVNSDEYANYDTNGQTLTGEVTIKNPVHTHGGSGSGGDDSGSGGQSGGGSGSGSASGSGGSGSGSSSGGGSTPSTPSEPTNPTENFTIPVKNEQTVKVEAEIKEGTANVSEITNETIDKVVNNKDSESKVDTITIDLSGAKQEVTGVTLSKESVQTLAQTTAAADNGIDTATIRLSKATVVLDNKTLETLVEQAKGNDIRLVVEDKDRKELNTVQQTSLSQHQVATTFEAYFVSDGQRIHDFKGGKAVVSIDFTPEAGKDTSYYHLVYVAENGEMTRYKTKYETGKLMFTATHFSDYAVIYDTGEKNETLKPEEEKADSADTDAKDDSSDTDDKATMDTSYSKLRLRVPISTKTTNVLKWTKQTGADGYVIYGAPCNTKKQIFTFAKLVTIKNGGATTWTHKNLKSGTYYKYFIKAYKLVNGKKVWLAKSQVVHSTTTGGKYGNAKAVKVNKSAVSLTVGKTFTIKAEQVLKDKPIAGHQNIKYESSNTKVASVSSKGVIKAKKKGICYIYVYAQNGVYKRIKVVVS